MKFHLTAAPLNPLVPAAGQLSADDVHTLYQAKRYDEIEAARLAGRLNDLMAGRAGQRTDAK